MEKEKTFITAIEKQILDCQNDDLLDLESKKIRLQILKTYLKKRCIESNNDDLINIYQKSATTFANDTGIDLFGVVEGDIQTLHEYIYSSNIYKYLENKNIKNYTFEELKNHIYEFCRNDDDFLNVVSAIDLYVLLDNIYLNENKKVYYMASELNKLFDDNLFSKCDDIITTNKDNQTIINRVKRKSSVYDDNLSKSFIRFGKLYKDNVISEDIYRYALEMSGQIFNSYLSSKLQIIDNDFVFKNR